MIYLLLAILCGSMLTIVMKISEGKISGKISMLAFNYLTCIVLSAVTLGTDAIFLPFDQLGNSLSLGLINGFFYMTALVLAQYNIRNNGVMLTNVFSKVGSLLIPILISICFFAEIPSVTQAVGAIIAVFSIILLHYEQGNQAAAKHWLLLLLLTEGMASAMSKIFEEVGQESLSGNFLLYTFGMAFLLCVAVILYQKEKPGKNEAFFGILIGVPNFLASRFLLKALEDIPAVIAYPIRGVAAIVIVSFVGVLFFGERLKKKQWYAMACILAAIVLLNI